jgi:opacity protein-like surface antigen
VTAGARFRFTPRNALEASYSFSPNQFSVQQGTGMAGPLYDRVDLVSFNYVHYLWAKTRIQPFTTAGLGLNRFSGPGLVVVSGLLPGPYPFNTDNGYQFAWNFGGGTDIVLRRHFALRLELRDYVTGQPSFITGASHNIVPSAGIVFRFK